MSEGIVVQDVGFVAKALVQEYSFLVREASSEPCEFTLTVADGAFDFHGGRYRDAPDICSLELHRELASYENHPPKTHCRVSETDLDDYRDSHAPRVAPSLHTPKAAREC